MVIGHLGDSRAWIFDPSADELIQMTVDHEGAWGGILRYVGGTGHMPDIITIDSPITDPWFLIVATDGLFEATSDDDLTDTLVINKTAGATAMANALVRRAELDMSRDNITVAVVPC
jgi:serine/threonine protein phosphatase PrpC